MVLEATEALDSIVVSLLIAARADRYDFRALWLVLIGHQPINDPVRWWRIPMSTKVELAAIREIADAWAIAKRLAGHWIALETLHECERFLFESLGGQFAKVTYRRD